MDIDEWVEYGLKMGFAESFCYMHDSSPMTDQEEEEYVVNGEQREIPPLKM